MWVLDVFMVVGGGVDTNRNFTHKGLTSVPRPTTPPTTSLKP